MDPAMQNLLLFGGGGGVQGLGGNQGGGGDGSGGDNDGNNGGFSQEQFQQQAAQQAAFAGYPQLMRQYLQQQQMAAMDPRMAAMMGGMGAMDQTGGQGGQVGGQMSMGMGMGMGMPGQMGAMGGQMGGMGMSMAQMGTMGMGMGGMPGGAGGGAGGGGSNDYMDANRMLLQRIQGQNQTDQFDGGAAASSASANGGDPYAENGILGPWSATSAGLLGKMAVNNQDKGKKVRRKPKDKPKRPLSAYNIFFKEERQRILEKIPEGEDPKAAAGGDAKSRKRKKRPHGKIGFENLAKVIGQRWQELTPEQVEYYKKKAEEDMKRYKDQMEEYLAKQDEGKKGEDDEDDDNYDEGSNKKVKSEK